MFYLGFLIDRDISVSMCLSPFELCLYAFIRIDAL